jgi:type 1 glutamine amidotransferase
MLYLKNIAGLLLLSLFVAGCKEEEPNIIVDPPPYTEIAVLTETKGYRHESIEAGMQMLLANASKWKAVFTEMKDSKEFSTSVHSRYEILVLLNTTGDLFEADEQTALENYVRNGGKILAIHAATDAEYDWPVYADMLGAWFNDHPAIQEATLKVNQPAHTSVKEIPVNWVRTDEWYNFKNMKQGLDVVVSIDETTYTGGTHGANHPISWCQGFGKGKVFYTAMGHTAETYSEPLFIKHIEGAVNWLRED